MFKRISDRWNARGARIAAIRAEAREEAFKEKDAEWGRKVAQDTKSWEAERKRLAYHNTELQKQLNAETKRHTAEEKRLRLEADSRVDGAHAEVRKRMKQLADREKKIIERDEASQKRMIEVDELGFEAEQIVAEYGQMMHFFKNATGQLFRSHDKMEILTKRIKEVKNKRTG